VKVYAAGNFVLMSDPEKEKKFVEAVKRNGEINRLISFYFKKEIETIMKVRQFDAKN
jgi:hypothetical protein